MPNYDVIDEKELKACCQRFNQIYNLTQEINYTFAERFAKLCMSNKEITAKNFADYTGYSAQRFYRMNNGKTTSMETFVAFCIVFEVDIQNAVDLLRSLGIAFNPTNIAHCAYSYLISECKGKSLLECNEILKAVGVAPLGDLS